LVRAAQSLLNRCVTTTSERPDVDVASVATRADSLVDIALWDLRAKHEQMPLWRLLGNATTHCPILAVGGYFFDQRSLGDVEDEFRGFADAGFRHVKIHGHERAVIERLLGVLGEDAALSVDLHMRFSTLADAERECVPLDDLGLEFLEDPFPSDRPDLTRALAARLVTPVAAGEDADGEKALLALAEAADVLRVDATTSGGIGSVLRVAEATAAGGRRVMTHAFVEMHAQVVGEATGIATAETIPYDSGANPVDKLLARTQSIEAGELLLSEEPGHGLALDWEKVCQFAREVTHLTTTRGRRWN
jgi:L-alanine-DL-glutamate epimerase-like enolase superfamily enzyme